MIGVASAIIIVLAAGYDFLSKHFKKQYRKEGLIKAIQESKKRRKPLLIIGDYTKKLRNVYKSRMRNLSVFSTKEFGAVYVSDANKYIRNKDDNLSELMRVADVVVLVYPFFFKLGNLMLPGPGVKQTEQLMGPGGLKILYCGGINENRYGSSPFTARHRALGWDRGSRSKNKENRFNR